MSKVMTFFPLDSFIILLPPPALRLLGERETERARECTRVRERERGVRRDARGAARPHKAEASSEWGSEACDGEGMGWGSKEERGQQLQTHRTILNQRNGLMALLAARGPRDAERIAPIPSRHHNYHNHHHPSAMRVRRPSRQLAHQEHRASRQPRVLS